MCVIRRPAGSQNQSLSPEVESFSRWAPMSIQRLMSAADETLLRNEQQTDFYHFFPSVMNLPVDLWRSESLSEPKSGTACSLCLCVSVSVCSSSCAAGFCLCVTFQQPGPSCHDFVSLLGDFFSFLLWCFFCRLSQPERQQKPNAGVYLSSCTQHTRATPILEIIVSLLRSGFIFTPFFLIPLSLALSPARFQNKPQTTSFTRWARLLRLNSPDRLTS